MSPSVLDNEVHIWFCQPEAIQDAVKLSAYKSVLSIQEIEQYDRFHFEENKHSYLVSHALLRHALSKYADVDAADWQFTSNDHGKPELIQGVGLPAMEFNLTHTTGLCACIITSNRRCGIDAEYVHRKNKLAAVARRMFAEEELLVLSDRKNSQHQFYDFWTLREAYVKALGTGLTGSSKSFHFTLDSENLMANINFSNEQQEESNNWQFKLFKPTPAHCLSVAFETLKPRPVVISEFIF